MVGKYLLTRPVRAYNDCLCQLRLMVGENSCSDSEDDENQTRALASAIARPTPKHGKGVQVTSAKRDPTSFDMVGQTGREMKVILLERGLMVI